MAEVWPADGCVTINHHFFPNFRPTFHSTPGNYSLFICSFCSLQFIAGTVLRIIVDSPAPLLGSAATLSISAHRSASSTEFGQQPLRVSLR